MAELDLDAIRDRAEAATRGPWHVEYFGGPGYPQRIGNDSAVLVADTHEGGGYPAHTAEFIAHARVDVPALVAEVRRLRAEVERLRADHGPLPDACREMRPSTTPGECPAHGFHPHNGMTCLDCPACWGLHEPEVPTDG